MNKIDLYLSRRDALAESRKECELVFNNTVKISVAKDRTFYFEVGGKTLLNGVEVHVLYDIRRALDKYIKEVIEST